MVPDIDLSPFCGTNRSRSYLSAPFSVGERTYATDGHIAISVPRRDDVPERDLPAGLLIEKVFAIRDGETWLPVTFALPHAETARCRVCRGAGAGIACETCNGTGDHQCDCEHCEAECEKCSGTGVIYGATTTWSGAEAPRISCETCGGTGREKDGRWVLLPGHVSLSAYLLSRVLVLPGPIKMAVRPAPERNEAGRQLAHFIAPVQLFCFAGGLVAVMPRHTSVGARHDLVADAVLTSLTPWPAEVPVP